MKRLAIFAGFDKHGIIDDYVVCYLKELKKVADIVFVYDTEFSEEELAKVKNLTIHQICKKHGEYDFGSYKRGYIWAKENNLLEKYDQLIFCNDSVYGPFYNLNIMFDKMATKDYDFWGPFVFDMDKKRRHVQSFFVVYNKNVFLSKVFDDFVMSIKKEETKQDIVNNYEIGGSKYLEKNGFTFGGLFESDINKTHYKQAFDLIKNGMPFLKINMFHQNSFSNMVPFGAILSNEHISETFSSMITKHIYRVAGEDNILKLKEIKFLRVFYNIIHRKFIRIRGKYTEKMNYKINISLFGVSIIVILLPKFLVVNKIKDK